MADPTNVEEMCSALIALDKGKPTALIALGVDNAETFSWDATSRETLKVLTDVLEQRKEG